MTNCHQYVTLGSMNEWRKSSFSFANGNCAEVAAWRKSSRSGADGCTEVASWKKSSHSTFNGDCAEVGQDGSVVGVRDSKLGSASPVLTFGSEAWAAFVSSLKL